MKLLALLFAVLLACSIFLPNCARAGSATWKSSPIDSDWNNPNNWTPATVPNGAADTATFGSSAISNISVSMNIDVAEIVYKAGASAYTITTVGDLTVLTADDVTNNSGLVQSFTNDVAYIPYNTFRFGSLGALIEVTGSFHISDTAGDNNFIIPTGFASYFDAAFADAGTGSYDVSGGVIIEGEADKGIFTINSGTGGNSGGGVSFNLGGRAESAVFTVAGSDNTQQYSRGVMSFNDESSAGDATIVASGGSNRGEGGQIFFNKRSTGGTVKITLSGNASVDISNHFTSPQVQIGSIAGKGNVFLGQFNLDLGGSSLNSLFAGVIQDGGIVGGSKGALTKSGAGVLTLTGPNAYTGNTLVTAGTLLLNNPAGSGTGTGTVQVRSGTLGGRGTIAGAVTIGTGLGLAAFLQPSAASNKTMNLTIQSGLAFQSDGTYIWKLDTRRANSDQVTTNGVTIEPGAEFNWATLGKKLLVVGTVLTVINNTSATPIFGTFSNLTDGGTIKIGSNTFQANYEGGDGNDLTLTVVQ